MKKILKSRIFISLITAIIFTGVGIYAETKISADKITYTDKNNVEKTVDTVLDDLYEKASANSKVDVIWVRDSQVTTIQPFDIEGDFSIYDYIIVEGSYDAGNYENYRGIIEIAIGSNGILNAAYNPQDITKRTIVTSNSKIEIKEGYGWDNSRKDGQAIPNYILGIKN